MITKEIIDSILYYKDGHLYWRNTTSHTKADERAGGFDYEGYIQIGINKRKYREHRLIFCMFYGFLPSMIDHINGKKHDNRIENLRECDKSTNALNIKKPCSRNKSGIVGVRMVKSGKWEATYKSNRLGCFKNKKDAIAARRNAVCGRAVSVYLLNLILVR